MKLGNHSGRLPNLQFLQVNSKQSFRACPSRRKSAMTLAGNLKLFGAELRARLPMILRVGYRKSFPSVWCALIGWPDRGDSPEGRQSLRSALLTPTPWELFSEKACSRKRWALTRQSIAPRRAMDGLRKCICAATQQPLFAHDKCHDEEKAL